jgi:hypothetical protein
MLVHSDTDIYGLKDFDGNTFFWHEKCTSLKSTKWLLANLQVTTML